MLVIIGEALLASGTCRPGRQKMVKEERVSKSRMKLRVGMLALAGALLTQPAWT
jgi:hypothetical protein